MSSPRRVLEAVTLRRVVAVLLIGAFAEPIASLTSWFVSLGWQLKDVATLRACFLAGISLVVQAGLIYLALRGAVSLIDRWRK